MESGPKTQRCTWIRIQVPMNIHDRVTTQYIKKTASKLGDTPARFEN